MAAAYRAFPGKVESGFPLRNATQQDERFQEKLALAQARVESGFPLRNAIQQDEHFQEKLALAQARVESGFPLGNAIRQDEHFQEKRALPQARVEFRFSGSGDRLSRGNVHAMFTAEDDPGGVVGNIVINLQSFATRN